MIRTVQDWKTMGNSFRIGVDGRIGVPQRAEDEGVEIQSCAKQYILSQ